MAGTSWENLDDPSLNNMLNCYGITYTWRHFHTAPQTFDFSELLAKLDEAADEGKMVVMRLKCHVIDRQSPWGNGGTPYVPNWILDSCAPETFYTLYENSTEYIEVLAPWDTCVTNHYLEFIDAFGKAGILTHPGLAGVYIHGISSSFGEEFWLDPGVIGDAEAAGMTAETLKQAYESRLNGWKNAAGKHVGKLVWVGAGWIDGYTSTQNELDQLVENLGMGRRSGGFEDYKSAFERAVRGQKGDWGVVFNETSRKLKLDPAFPFRSMDRYLGGEDENFGTGQTYAEWFATTMFVESFLQTKFVWIPYEEEILSEHEAMLTWFSKTAGKSLIQRPDACAWLREDNYLLPETGNCVASHNIEIGLYQTNVTDTPATYYMDRGALSWGQFFRDCDNQHGDYIARKTDIANNKREFQFEIDSRFITNEVEEVQISVIYLDDSDATWDIVGPNDTLGSHTNPHLDGWRSISLRLSLSYLKTDDGTYQFSLRVTNDTDLTVRMVRVVKF